MKDMTPIAIKVFMGIQSFYLLLPVSLIGSIGIMYWFLLLVPFGLYSFFQSLFTDG